MEQASSGQPFYLNDTETVTVEQLKTSDLRSLGDNVKLLAVIQNLSHELVTKSENTYKKLDEIQCETEIKSVGVKNLINEFQMLADSQFIENRIYEADQTDLEPDSPSKSSIEEGNSKTPPDQKILPIIHECISNSLKFIDENFTLEDKQLKQIATESDDEDDYVKETLARAMESNPFNKTPLPAIIGSHAFFNQSIFNDGENRVLVSQNDNQSDLSSDKNSIISGESDEDSDTLFSPNKAINISIKPGVIPPPPPMPNFKSMPDDDDDDDGETLFPVDATTQITQSRSQLPPLPQSRQFDESDDEDDNLFSPEKTTAPPRIIPQLPVLPVTRLVKNSDNDDDDDDDLFSKGISKNNTVPAAQNQPKMIKVLPSQPLLKPKADSNTDDEDDEDSDDLFKPPQVKPRNSIASLQETLKPSSATIDTKRQPDKKPDIWDLDSDHDDDEKLFPINKTKVVLPRVLPPLPSLTPSKPFDESADDDDYDDNLFSTKKTAPAPPRIIPQLPVQPATRPVQNSDDDDLFSKISSKNNAVPAPQNLPETVKVLPSQPLLKPKANSNTDDEDSDDLFKPPKVKPRSSKASSQETLKPSSATIDTKKQPEKKPDIWDLDSDHDDDLFKTVK